ncbi:MAG: regulatory iron-sulfur-containing complex subunit RicT [Candidatus Margulisiibacteriota bacterium]
MSKLAIRLRKFGRVCPITGYNEQSIKVGAPVIVGTDRGVEFGWIIAYPKGYPHTSTKDVRLKKVIRYASEEDLKIAAGLEGKEETAQKTALEKIKQYDLPIKIVNVEVIFDGARTVYYYKVEENKKIVRGTRDLEKDLSRLLQTRVEMKQVSPRDVARMLGGLGPCGKNLCCATWLTKPKHVTVKMVKEQGLQLSPTKTAGICGRLMCCLGYEIENVGKKADLRAKEGPGR